MYVSWQNAKIMKLCKLTDMYKIWAFPIYYYNFQKISTYEERQTQL